MDEDACVCGATYRDSHFGVSFAEGCEYIRQRSDPHREECGGGGWRSRRAVLWAMRVIKLERWYEEHMMCGMTDGDEPVEVVDGMLVEDGMVLF